MGGDMPRAPKEYHAFTSLVDRLLAVPRETIQRRLDAHKAQSNANPRKRGPKPKATRPASDASRDPADE
jgi:hypothetical protein